MKRVLRFAVRLYPARWRARYGEEFETFLLDVKPGGRDVLNVVKGALEMQMMEWTFARITIATGVAVALAASAVMAYAIPNIYISDCVLRIVGADGENATEQVMRLQQKVLSRKSLTAIIMKEGLYERQRLSMPLEDVVLRMRTKDIRINFIKAPTPGGKASALLVSFQYPDPVKAQRTDRDLETGLMEASASAASSLEVLDMASLPEQPAAPNRLLLGSMGLGAGLFVGALVALIVKRLRIKSTNP